MTRLTIGIVIVALARIARADDPTAGGGEAPAPGPAPVGGDVARLSVDPLVVVQGNGVKVGESTTLYPTLGLETGYVSNVFYDDSNPISAGLVRVLAEAGVGSLATSRLNAEVPEPGASTEVQGDFRGRADAYAAWDQYISTNDNVTEQSGLSGGLILRALANGDHTISVSFLDQYQRVIRPTNFESSHDTNRDINTLHIRLNVQPKGRTLGGYLYYTHVLDLFEQDSQQFADRFDNRFGGHITWQWLPLTRVYVDVSEGVYGGIGSSSTKVSSYPLAALAGIMTNLSVNATLHVRAGYTQGFYASGPDYASALVGVQLGYRYSPFGRIQFLYSYIHEDSINANFYRDHVFEAQLDHQLEPFAIFIRPELHLREYDGVIAQAMPTTPNRDDVIFAAWAGARYNFRSSIAATLEYHVTSDQTDFRYGAGAMLDDPSYVRHELMVGLRGAL
jgi:opacity protein-like surface antigen